MDSLLKNLFFVLVSFCFFNTIPMANAQESEPVQKPIEKNETGLFIEVGGFGSFPLSGGETPITFLNLESDGLSPGGGGLLAIGYDAKNFAVGGKFKQSFYPGADFVSHLLFHTKIFPFDIFNVDLGPFRPYGLLDLGIGFALVGEGGSGFDLNTGLGIQWFITEHAYMAFETTYAGLFAGELDVFADSFDPIANGNIHAIDVGLNVGVKF